MRVCVCGYACLVAQSYPVLCDPMNCSPPGSSVRGITQARLPEWFAVPSPGDLLDLRIESISPALPGGFLGDKYPILGEVNCFVS